MNLVRNNGAELWDICSPMAVQVCDEAKRHNLGINSTIYPFKTLAPSYLVDIEDWDDVEIFITIAIYYLSLYYLQNNLPLILKSKFPRLERAQL